ncbi:MAG: site-specific integrase [Chloroflexi bacterium]|nr:site-specific integrase [Chloroflexota bacterium]
MTPVQLGLFRPNTPLGGDREGLPVNVTPKDLDLTSSLLAALTAFHEHMRQQGFSENTIKAFGGDLNMFCRHLGVNKAVGEVTTQDLKNFMDYLRYHRGVPCSMKSYQRRLTSLKVFFTFLYEHNILDQDLAAPIMHQPAITPLPEILSDAQVKRLLETTRALLGAVRPDARPHLLISLILTTGIKKSEAMSMRPSDIELTHPDQPFVFIRYDDPRRWHKERKLRLPTDFPETYRQYLEQYQPSERVFECTPRNLEYVLTDTARLADLEGKVTFETLRWTSAVRDAAAGMREETLRQKMGLSTITWQEAGEKIKRLAMRPI